MNYFNFREFFLSETAKKNSIPNIPTSPNQLHNLASLWSMLNELRTDLKAPIYINSAFRSPDLNRAVKGAPNSLHMYGRAADIRTIPEKMDQLWTLLQDYDLTECIKYDTFYHIAL